MILHNVELPKHLTCNDDAADTKEEYHRPENVALPVEAARNEFQVEAVRNLPNFHTLVRPQVVVAVEVEVQDSQNWGLLG
jgi:hypothetical protein